MCDLDLRKIVGKLYSSREVQVFMSQFAPIQEENDPISTTIYYVAEASGVSVCVERRTCRIDTVFLHGERDRPKFRGALPGDLDFSMTRSQVQALMRPADRSMNTPIMSDAWEEGDYKLVVNYSKADQSIEYISLTGK